ncbi:hypothetical protein CATRI_02775 [Corynebacterium atrinae]|nr:hypothetical protein CATRI_02775 [Corynebacterium atrinae]
MKKNNAGFGTLVLFALVVMAVLWVVGVALWLLSIAVPIAGLIFGCMIFSQANDARRQVRTHEAVDSELEALRRDASLELAETIARFDTLVVTKGIGTELYGHDDQAAEIYRQLLATHESLQLAATPTQKIESVLQSDTARRDAERYL